ncbi:U-box domain-containing protein 21-like [Phoenix dactylifera]|uniref:U-box domain-containing protein n=1 Tax=Phoenix dactylifera TaxID=42345 RepID=A0A8B9AF04_PHODC|nr:U-box domain-containing protein 21 [Phoenix dactylifera]XP_038985301.1 U-box domain-containing protein 21-like [Phoenix dactylifera]
MATTWRALKRGQKIPFVKRSPVGNPFMEPSIPTHFRCPISLDLMKDPVTVSTGITYDRQSIETWFEHGNQTCPVTNMVLKSEDLIPNHSLRRMIQDWCVANRSLGVERIPTPRIPASPAQVAELLSEIASASRRGDHARCRELVGKIKALGRESERNRRCIVSGGAGRVLSASFSELAAGSLESSTSGVLEEILSALAAFSPLDEVARRQLGSPESLKSFVSILNSRDLAGRLNAVLMLKELVSSFDTDRINVVAETEGLIEALVKLIEKPISPQTTKASLVVTFYLLSSRGEKAAMKFVEMGLVSLLLEILVDSDKSMCEKALAVLDGVLKCKKARDTAYDHSLAMPVLVKKMFRVSDMATEFAVSALWKLCRSYNQERGEREGEGCLVEALQVGAFQKLLLLLQVGCTGATKGKASELLKLLNGFRGRGECIETVDLKGLKRPF